MVQLLCKAAHRADLSGLAEGLLQPPGLILATRLILNSLFWFRRLDQTFTGPRTPQVTCSGLSSGRIVAKSLASLCPHQCCQALGRCKLNCGELRLSAVQWRSPLKGEGAGETALHVSSSLPLTDIPRSST